MDVFIVLIRNPLRQGLQEFSTSLCIKKTTFTVSLWPHETKFLCKLNISSTKKWALSWDTVNQGPCSMFSSGTQLYTGSPACSRWLNKKINNNLMFVSTSLRTLLENSLIRNRYWIIVVWIKQNYYHGRPSHIRKFKINIGCELQKSTFYLFPIRRQNSL